MKYCTYSVGQFRVLEKQKGINKYAFAVTGGAIGHVFPYWMHLVNMSEVPPPHTRHISTCHSCAIKGNMKAKTFSFILIQNVPSRFSPLMSLLCFINGASVSTASNHLYWANAILLLVKPLQTHTAAVISGHNVQMNLRVRLWSVMQCHFFQGLLMRSSASFGWGLKIIIIFCPEGNAIFLIKPWSRLDLRFYVGHNNATEPSQCHWIIMS